MRFQSTIRCAVYCCTSYMLLLLSIVQLHCKAHTRNSHIDTDTYTAVYCGRLHSIGKKHQRSRPKKRLKPKTFWTLSVVGNAHAHAWGMWQLWQQQLTAVATFTQHTHIHIQTHTRYTRLTAAISEKANQRQATHVTLQFISDFFCFSLLFVACNKIKFINSQRQRQRRVTLKRNYSHPHGWSRNSFPQTGRETEPSSVECASECVRVCVCVCSFIQKDSFAFAIRLREASYNPLPLYPSPSLAASIYAHHVFSFSRMTKYRLLRCNTSQEGGIERG